MNTPYNTGRVLIGKLYQPTMPARESGSVSGPYHRSDRIVMTGGAVAVVVLCIFMLVGWVL